MKDAERLCPTSKLTTVETFVGQPPNNYRQLPIIPNIMELLSDYKPFLRKNIVDGVYEDADHYLDVS